ncbi:MAG TPA: FMN-binding protein [Actinoplanes sp.]
MVSGTRRIALMAASTVTGVVLLFSYRTSLGGAVPSAAAPGAAAPGIVPDTAAPRAPSSSGSAHPNRPAKTLTVNGTVAQTRWGPVQVQLKITGGRIVAVQVLQRPSGNSHDDEVNGYALPQLRSEVLSAQSANIDTVGGATVTSDGYIESLQAALDAAHRR